MNYCKYYDCGWCYAPNDVENNATQGECTFAENCPYLKSQMNNQTNKVEKDSYTTISSSMPIEDDIVLINNVKYKRIEEQSPQPPKTLYDRFSDSLDGYIYSICDTRLKSTLCTIVGNWLPKELEHKSINSYSSGWNDCLTHLRKTIK
jgi:hypothetical protein